MRRFTTDSGRVPTIASITTQRGSQGGQDSQDYGPSVSYLLLPSANTLFPLSLITKALSLIQKSIHLPVTE